VIELIFYEENKMKKFTCGDMLVMLIVVCFLVGMYGAAFIISERNEIKSLIATPVTNTPLSPAVTQIPIQNNNENTPYIFPWFIFW